jgi:hypothetical protein
MVAPIAAERQVSENDWNKRDFMERFKLNNMFRPAMAILTLAGCASPAPTPDTLITLPQEQVVEVRYDAAIPAAVAYKNILERAGRCWQDRWHVLFAESFSSKAGSARMSMKYRGYGFTPKATLVVVEVTRDGEAGTRLRGRSLLTHAAIEKDLQNLQLWAEGKTAECAWSS